MESVYLPLGTGCPLSVAEALLPLSTAATHAARCHGSTEPGEATAVLGAERPARRAGDDVRTTQRRAAAIRTVGRKRAAEIRIRGGGRSEVQRSVDRGCAVERNRTAGMRAARREGLE